MSPNLLVGEIYFLWNVQLATIIIVADSQSKHWEFFGKKNSPSNIKVVTGF